MDNIIWEYQDAYKAGNQAINSDMRNMLTGLVDRNGLVTLINELSNICNEKSKKMLENGQETYTARYWKQDAKRLDTLAYKVNN